VWPFKKIIPEKKPTTECDFTISGSGMTVLSQYEKELADLLWSALENQANLSNTKYIDTKDVKKVGEQVVAALKQLIEEFEELWK
jgi:ABC-type transporter Mla MlaB component